MSTRAESFTRLVPSSPCTLSTSRDAATTYYAQLQRSRFVWTVGMPYRLHRILRQYSCYSRQRCCPASSVRAQRHAEEDLARLASSVHNAAKYFPQLIGSSATLAEVEVSGVLAESVAAIASASDAVFSAVESISSAATIAVASSSKKPSASLISLVTRSSKAAAASSDEDKEIAALDRLEGLNECIANK
ncbi:hypothetical protein SETIT_4G037400v2 [Setaria italica]|uniref:Uncharacterized protein n=1 Tax=Setaria italica TaxID=4555 RepID=A0A368QQG1_SETIT|nr:hypothetical protein SETIT_4G037400v2 [Setaria italica]